MDASHASNGVRPETVPGATSGIERLNRALDSLEQAVDARLEREAELGDAEAEVQRMSADRARLAEALDSASARSQRLEATNREVSRRLVDAMEAIRAVLDGQMEHKA
jgi:chromosome segregation ATPase